MSYVNEAGGTTGAKLYTHVMEDILYIPIAEAGRRLGMTVAEVEALVAAGALEARETESGTAVAEDDVADREMLTLTSGWARNLRRTVRRSVTPGKTLPLLREARGQYDSGEPGR
jgi:type IV secretory pathway TrbL component